MRAPLLGMAAVFVALWCAYYAVSEPGPRVSPWVSPLPSHAVAAGYRAFVATAPGRAIPAWPEAVMERWPPKADGPILIDQGGSDQFLDLLKPEALAEAMAARRQGGIFRMQKGYDHSYFFVSTFMPDHIAFHSDALRG